MLPDSTPGIPGGCHVKACFMAVILVNKRFREMTASGFYTVG